MTFGFRRLAVPALTFISLVFLAGVSAAQTRTINSDGTATGGGTVKITIEDFNKPEWRDLNVQSTSPQASFTIEVTVQAGWTCEQTTQAIFNALVEVLPDGYALSILTRQPCTIIIACKKGYTCDDWEFTEFVETVPGQTIEPGEPGVPTETTTWGSIKARHYD